MRHHVLRNRRRFAVFATLLIAALAVPAVASAARRHTVIANTDKAAPLTGWTVGPDGNPRLGVHLANIPGGFYMGRLFKPNTAFTSTSGQTFDRHTFTYNGQSGDIYHSSKSDYAWGYAVGQIGACLWIGPSAGEPAYTLGQYLSASTPGFSDRCSQSQIDFLKGNSGGNIGSHFNCDPTSPANFGTRKTLLQDTDFYYGIQWGGATGYDGGPGVNYAGRITVASGPRVYYRYTTRDTNWINVYVEGWGWGFMPRVGTLDRSRTGYYNRPGNPDNISCNVG